MYNKNWAKLQKAGLTAKSPWSSQTFSVFFQLIKDIIGGQTQNFYLLKFRNWKKHFLESFLCQHRCSISALSYTKKLQKENKYSIN